MTGLDRRGAGAIVLTGPMGAGKSSVGRRVAKTLGLPFADTDKLVAATHGPIADLFSTHGEAHFRRLERAAVAKALAGGGVVALGGGAVLHPETRADLHAHRVVLLTIRPDAVGHRISAGTRPLLAGGDDPIARWQRIWEDRRAVYEEVADLVVDTSSRPMTQIADEIAAWAQAAVVAR